MAISQAADSGDYTFTSPVTHGPLMTQGPPERDIQIARYSGVVGESHFISPRRGMELFVPEVTLQANTEALLLTALHSLRLQAGELTGTLTVDNANYRDCTFLGYFEDDRFYDPANGKWISFGVLRWRQRKITDNTPPVDP